MLERAPAKFEGRDRIVFNRTLPWPGGVQAFTTASDACSLPRVSMISAEWAVIKS